MPTVFLKCPIRLAVIAGLPHVPKGLGRRRRATALLALLSTLFLSGCGRSDSERPVLTVFAAASLADAAEEIARSFEAEHSAEIVHNFASSGALAQQLIHASRADVFLSASIKWMDALEQAGRLVPGSRGVFLSNQLVVVAPAGGAFAADGPERLCEMEFGYLCIGDPAHVPAGRYAKEWLEEVECGEGGSLWDAVEARVNPAPDVRAALFMVARSRDMLGIVYATDLKAQADALRAIHLVPPEEGPGIDYGAGQLIDSASPDLARAYLDFLESEAAGEIFKRHGFRLPKR